MPARKTVKEPVEEQTSEEEVSAPAKPAPKKKAAAKPKAAPKRKPKAAPKTAAKPAPKKAPAKKAVKKADSDEEDDTPSGKRSFKLMDEVSLVDLSGLSGSTLKSKLDEVLASDFSSRLSEADEVMDREKLPKKGGKYTGKNPLQSAKKAFRAIAKCFPDEYWESSPVILFSIKETTRGSKNNQFAYFASRQKLDSPNRIVRGETSYEVKNTIVVRSARVRKQKGAESEDSEESAEE